MRRAGEGFKPSPCLTPCALPKFGLYCLYMLEVLKRKGYRHMARPHKGEGWKRLTLTINPHIVEIEKQIGAHLKTDNRSVIVAAAIKAMSEAVEAGEAVYQRQYFLDYADHVVTPVTGKTTTLVHWKDETEAQIEVIGQWFETHKHVQLLKSPHGYNRKYLTYMALRWYAHQMETAHVDSVERLS